MPFSEFFAPLSVIAPLIVVAPLSVIAPLQVAAQGPDPKEMEEKVDRMTSELDVLQSRYARLLAEHEATQSKLKHRVATLERKLRPPLPPPLPLPGDAPPPPTPEA